VHLLKKFNTCATLSTRETKKQVSLSHDEIRIIDAIAYIQEHYAELVTLDDIADSIHVSKSECCRCFKRAVNITPFEYLMRYRILQAADKILQNDREMTSISELASSVGFNNTSYFNKLFKKYFNCTPTEYRKLSKTEHRDQLSPFGLSLTHI
ncbi:MAG: helix-turn-helix transcriptional regulator, partial [Lachnospiraceae bacterium]|nr:helix-turn-helix transcriptional regulator [Lachnospiraceae bacterium]